MENSYTEDKINLNLVNEMQIQATGRGDPIFPPIKLIRT